MQKPLPRIAGATMLLLMACGDSQGPDEPRAGSISITAPAQVMEIDATMQLSASVLNTTGGAMANPVVTWRSSNTSVAEISGQGVVTGRNGGTTMIHATSGSVSDSIQITVRPRACSVAAVGASIAIGTGVQGALDASTCLLPHGAPGDGRRIVIATPVTLAITMTSTTLDALIVVTNLNLEIVGFNDDGGGGTDARLLLPLAAGEYVIWATTFEGEAGSYQLQVETATTGSCTEPRGSINLGQTVSGTLTEAGSCLLGTGHFADIWQFTTTAVVTVTADLTSASLDSYLLLADSADNVIAADDDSGGSFNSRIVHTLDPGTYTFWATTYDPGALGSYQLRVAAASAGDGNGAASRASPKDEGWVSLRPKH